MKNSKIITTLACMNVALLSGCAQFSLSTLKNAPREGSVYSQELAKQYEMFADNEQKVFFDQVSTSIFSKKGQLAASGQGESIAPECPCEWLIKPPLKEEMIAQRQDLTSVVQACSQKAPVETAAAVVNFDKWVEQSAEGFQPQDIEEAHTMFTANLAAAKQRCMATPIAITETTMTTAEVKPLTHVSVYFKLNSSVLDSKSKKTLDDFKANIHPLDKVVTKGFTDACGTEKRNSVLSVERANAVKKYLVDVKHAEHEDVAEAIAKGKGIAPNSPKFEPHNRRVDVKVLNPSHN